MGCRLTVGGRVQKSLQTVAILGFQERSLIYNTTIKKLNKIRDIAEIIMFSPFVNI